MGRVISKYVPKPLQKYVLWIVNKSKRVFRKAFYFGFAYYCPVCNSRLRKFIPLIVEDYSRLDAKCCPVCRSKERHRWVCLYLREKTNLFSGQPLKMLHIAPEEDFVRLFKKIPGIEYLSGDLIPGRAMEQMDITDIHHPDNTFDIIYCSHVLEHVPDDHKAISEFYRILKQNGWAMILVPLFKEKTFEDVSITDSEKRREIFGHPEHVRKCGPDYADRLRQVGFQVNIENANDYIAPPLLHRFGLNQNILFLCNKKGTAS